jgi:hypothetical protein
MFPSFSRGWRPLSWPLFACLKKELKMDLSNDTSGSRLKRKSAIIEREFEKGE